MLFRQWRHVGPMVVDVGDVVGLEYLLVVLLEQTWIPNLHSIAKVFRELAEERIQL